MDAGRLLPIPGKRRQAGGAIGLNNKAAKHDQGRSYDIVVTLSFPPSTTPHSSREGWGDLPTYPSILKWLAERGKGSRMDVDRDKTDVHLVGSEKAAQCE